MRDSVLEFAKSIENVYRCPMLTDIEVAEILGVHRETVYRLRRSSQGPPFFKIGKKVVCMRKDFIDWFIKCSSENIPTGSKKK